MTKKPTINQAEHDLFLAAMGETKPLKKSKERVQKKSNVASRQPKPTFHEGYQIQPLVEINTDLVSAEATLSYKHHSVPDKTLRKLRKGQYNVDAVLDLHGMTVAEARQELTNTFNDALTNQMRVILIIHGKGRHTDYPILKNKVKQWLQQTEEVLAFHSAKIDHGGRGAVYALLKCIKEENSL